MIYGVIYMMIFPNNKRYIGQTQNFKVRKRAHHNDAFNKNSNHYHYVVYRAIRKYGFDNVIWKILHKNVPRKELNKHEIFEVSKYDSFHNGYNGTPGGDAPGFEMSEESKKKISKAHRGKKRSPLSEETKRKIGEANKVSLKGRKVLRESVEKSRKTRLKNGSSRGENSALAKLTWKQVKEIRTKYIPYTYTGKMLSNEYGVCYGTISSILSNKRWKIDDKLMNEIKENRPKPPPKIPKPKKGLAYGERNGKTKLTWKQVQEIRAKFKPYIYTRKMLAKEYNTNTHTIDGILSNLRWKIDENGNPINKVEK